MIRLFIINTLCVVSEMKRNSQVTQKQKVCACVCKTEIAHNDSFRAYMSDLESDTSRMCNEMEMYLDTFQMHPKFQLHFRHHIVMIHYQNRCWPVLTIALDIKHLLMATVRLRVKKPSSYSRLRRFLSSKQLFILKNMQLVFT